MTDKSTKLAGSKPVPMKLFAAWEVDRTPPNCIPRLCSLTITRLSLLTPLPTDMTSLSLAVKMQSSKRTLRSHEISLTQNQITASSYNAQQQQQQQPNIITTSQLQQQQQQQHQQQQQQLQSSHLSSGGNNTMNIGQNQGQGNTTTTTIGSIFASVTGSGGSSNVNSAHLSNTATNNQTGKLFECDLDLHFSLQYPHFIKRDGNRLIILLQRRKKYKTRTILGYKTLAEGAIRMDAVLQKSMDMSVELMATGKSGRPGTTVATLRAERVSSIPVDQDNKNNNSVLLTDRVNEYSDDDEEGEFSSGEENEDGIDGGYNDGGNKRDYNQTKHEMRKYRKLQRTGNNDGEGDDGGNLGTNPGDSDSEFEMKDKGLSRAKISRTISLQQRNFKQKIVALLKRFKVTEEMDGGVTRTSGRGERELDALFQELESLSCGEGDDSGPDMDSLSIGSTPKPSLRPFFTNSRNMLHENLTGGGTVVGRRSSEKSDTGIIIVDNKKSNSNSATTPEYGPDYKNDSSGNEGNAANTDPEGQNSDPQNNTGSPPRDSNKMQPQSISLSGTSVVPVSSVSTPLSAPPQVTHEKRNRLFRTSSSTPGSGKKKQSLSLSTEPKSVLETCLSPTNVEPRKLLLDQLSKVFSMEEVSMLPDVVTILSPPEACSSHLVGRLNPIFSTQFRPSFAPQNTAEVKAVLQALMAKIQKYCNSNAKPPTTIKILLLGGDWLQGAVLRHYVELFGVRPPDWVHHLRFYIVPIVTSTLARHLCLIDSFYYSLFGTEAWIQLCERTANLDSNLVKSDILEITNRIQRYLHTAGPCTQLPIAEAMVNYKDEDSCQIFVPFVCDVRIGYVDGPSLSLDLEENTSSLISQQSNINSALSSSPPLSGRNSPPSISTINTTPSQHQQIASALQEAVELQIDYWQLVRHSDIKDKSLSKGGDQGKNSIKNNFRNLQVWRLPLNPQFGETGNGLTVSFATKEKKQKIMRLGKKKEKDRDQDKEQCIEGVARLICSPKQSHPIPLKVYIDGTEWSGVKFFQLSSQWQTHVKNFPVALIGAPIPCSELS